VLEGVPHAERDADRVTRADLVTADTVALEVNVAEDEADAHADSDGVAEKEGSAILREDVIVTDCVAVALVEPESVGDRVLLCDTLGLSDEVRETIEVAVSVGLLVHVFVTRGDREGEPEVDDEPESLLVPLSVTVVLNDGLAELE
jgi:hypothetical protein